ncbi:MAG: ANTAR domain-containing protein, partial [Clostridia bacterium]|nr:ANTAR domain-containing protein [Clostridia bacterium]
YDDAFDRLAEHGVFLMQKPVSRQAFQLAAGWLVSARERVRRTERKTQSIEAKMNEIRLVNRAKWLLISELKMTEPDAHRYIEKQAMDRCVSKRQIAEEIIKTYG